MTTVFLATLVVLANPQTASFDSPEWRRKIETGFVPYHRVQVSDFKVVENAPTDDDIYTTGFVDYSYRGVVLSRRPLVVGVTQITVYSGLNRNLSWRRSTLTDPAKYIDHEQGHLDLNELHARRFAQITAFPQGTGADLRSAQADLAGKVNRLFREYDSVNQREQELYDKETQGGTNLAKQQVWRANIDARLKTAGVSVTWRG